MCHMRTRSNRPLDHQLASSCQRLVISFHDALSSAHLVLVGCPNATGYGFMVIYVNASAEEVEIAGDYFTVPKQLFFGVFDSGNSVRGIELVWCGEREREVWE